MTDNRCDVCAEVKPDAIIVCQRCEDDSRSGAGAVIALKQRCAEYARVLLRAYMHELSERYTCASWLIGLEEILWRRVVDGPATEPDDDVLDVDAEAIAKLKQLSEDAGGWWTYEGFVTAEEWAKWYETSKR